MQDLSIYESAHSCFGPSSSRSRGVALFVMFMGRRRVLIGHAGYSTSVGFAPANVEASRLLDECSTRGEAEPEDDTTRRELLSNRT
ncbi:MAG TPA: hypothetical protein VMU98_06080 [Acidimicrobiales bacterium]|nr:hypothetical protein [Acidimicrobiales bacterium]